MRRYDEKVTHMVRSALPSTHRKAARNHRARVTRAARRRVRSDLFELRRVDALDVATDLMADTGRAIRKVVAERRGWDQLGPLLHWAQARIDQNPALAAASPDDKYHHFKALLPDTVAGRHALSHIEWVVEWSRGGDPWLFLGWFDDMPPRPDIAAMVERLIRDGRHGELNARIKQAWRSEQHAVGHRFKGRRPILLAGLHDVARFTRAIEPRSPERDIVYDMNRPHPGPLTMSSTSIDQ